MASDPARLLGLLRAIETVTGDLSLELVLRNIVESVRDLAGAQYAALGVIGSDGTLEQFIHVGVSEQQAERIGPLPAGKGLLGALIRDPRPIRLQRIGSDRRSVGFPPNHPAMDSFLGVPIDSRGEIYGNLYLANSATGAFTAEDEELVTSLASAAGTAIGNARLYRDAQLKQQWLAASVEIGNQLLASDGEDPLRLIARHAMNAADADLVSIGLVTADGENMVIEVAFGEQAEQIIARRFPLDDTLSRTVLEDGEPIMLAHPGQSVPEQTYLAGVMEAGPLMVLRLQASGHTRGVLSLLRRSGRPAFTESEMTMAAGFAGQASVALELAQARSVDQKLKLHEDRDRIARDLHDHVIQELFAIGISLDGVAAELRSERLGDPLAQRVTQRVDDIDRTIRRIRTSIFELRGNLGMSSDGLSKRVLEVTSDVTPALGFTPQVVFGGLVDIRVDAELTEDVVAAVRETLTNVAKHAHASAATVDVALAGNELTITVSDNGIGVKEPARSSGTTNLRRRAEQRGGSFELSHGVSGGTTAKWKALIQ